MASYKKTFNDVLDELLNLSSESLSDFTTYRDEDPLVILHKLIAAMSISSNKYINKYINSKFIQPSGVMDTRSRYLLLQTFDMLPNKVIPGTIDVIFEYLGGYVSEQIEIPAGTEFLVGENEIPFTILDDYYIKSDTSFISIKLIEGEYIEEEFDILNITNNRLELESESVAIDYVKVRVDDTEYKMINYAEYSSELNAFSVEYTIDHHYNIVFSEETVSKITETSIIYVSYIQSTGTNDYDPLDDDIVIDSEILLHEDEDDEEDVSDQLAVNTISGYTIGDTNHNEHNNYNKLSEVLSTFRQAITIDDYGILTDYYPGVAVSAAYDCNSPSATIPQLDIFSPFLAKIVIAPVSGYYMTKQFRMELLQYLRSVGLSEEECYIELIDPEYVEVNITVGVGTTTNNQSEMLDIYSTINNTINDYFKIGNIRFGSFISKDYIASMIAKSDDRIDYVDVLEFSDAEDQYYYSGYQLNAVQLPILDNLNIIFNYAVKALSDNINYNESISGTNIMHYLQGDKAENTTVSDTLYNDIEVNDTSVLTDSNNNTNIIGVTDAIDYSEKITGISNSRADDTDSLTDEVNISIALITDGFRDLTNNT